MPTGTETLTRSDDTTSGAPLMSVAPTVSEDGLMSVDPTLSDGKQTQTRSELASGLDQAYTEEDAGSSREDTIRTATEDLGQVSALDDSFASRVGNLADAICPNVGNESKLTVRANIPVYKGELLGLEGAVNVSIIFSANVARSKEGVTISSSIGGGVTAAGKADIAFVATVKAWAQASLAGTIASTANTSTQAFKQLLLGVQRQVGSASTDLADAMFTPAFITSTIAGMDDDDKIESSLTASFSAGAGAKGDGPDDTEAKASVGFERGWQTTTTKKDGKLVDEEQNTAKFSLGGEVGPLGAKGELSAVWGDGKLKKIEGKLEGTGQMSIAELQGEVIAGNMLSNAVTNVSALITGKSGMLDDANASRRAGALANFIAGSSGSGSVMQSGALARIKDMGILNDAKIGVKVTVGACWEDGKGFSFKLSLDKTSNFEFGEDEHLSPIWVQLENTDNIAIIDISG